MSLPLIPFWKKAPFVRILFPFIIGIIVQWYGQFPFQYAAIIGCAGLTGLLSFSFLPFFKQYTFSALTGIAIFLVFTGMGGVLSWQKDIRHTPSWFGHSYTAENYLQLTLTEPLVEKTKSYKAIANVANIITNEQAIPVSGSVIVYFKKDSLLPAMSYGQQLLIKKPLQDIKNAGNPGGFNYKQYSLFQGITHQLYLTADELEVLPGKQKSRLHQMLYSLRKWVLNVLRQNIKGTKELGLAEALLIGYKDDLDKTLVQSYTNTGVVHIIAISGLHLGLIYWLLVKLFHPLRKRKNIAWLRPVLIITGLWLFSLLAGAQPSVLRSAVMFTCIVLGESFSRKSYIYNTLALSAFLLLCYNPYWLWDVGFQLSYAAVLSIIIFMQPVYNWLYIKNKALDLLWKLNAVTIAAQILTIPISIYHFHQFPTWFLLTNFLAVPVSSLILIGEIVLCCISFIPWLAALLGKVLGWLIYTMNTYVENIETIPFSLWDGLQISLLQAILLLICIAGASYWLLEKNILALKIGFTALVCFVGLRSWSFIQREKQQKLIIYNVPQHQAIDFINGRTYSFAGDTTLLEDDFARNFHLKPSRILHRLSASPNAAQAIVANTYISYGTKKIMLIDKTTYFTPTENKPEIDLLIISKNPKLYITKFTAAFSVKQVVADGSVPAWKVKYWKKDCDSLHIPFYDVNEKGAFIMPLSSSYF
jgi:competence protein ComEC